MRWTMLLLLSLAACGCAQAPPPPEEDVKLAPYYPTPLSVVEEMLKLGTLKKGERMFDLGSGDGRIVIMAAQKFGANATGVEIDTDLVKRSEDRIKELGLEKTAKIIEGDIALQDYSSADLITIYLLPESNAKMKPILEEQLRKGSRVVAHDFQMTGWEPVQIKNIEDDGEGRSHTLYLYVR